MDICEIDLKMCESIFLCCLLPWILITAILLVFIPKLTQGRTRSNVCLVGKIVLITGGNSGLGYQSALILAGRGAKIIIADKGDASLAAQNITKFTNNNNIITKFVDFASLESIRRLAEDINATEERLDILINNAGIGYTGKIYADDGLLNHIQVNHLGGFLLTHLLIGKLKKSSPSRIIFTSSLLAFMNNLSAEILIKPRKPYINQIFLNYADSKLCNIITANGFAAKLAGSGVTCNSVHPGLVATNIFKGPNKILVTLGYHIVLRFFGKDPYEGAQTIVHCALSTKVKDTTGELFSDCKPYFQPSKARDKEFCEKIWKQSEDLVQLKPWERM